LDLHPARFLVSLVVSACRSAGASSGHPLAITAERRQSISPHGCRPAFAVFAEAGLYRQPMPMKFNLDAYVQAGIFSVLIGLAADLVPVRAIS